MKHIHRILFMLAICFGITAIAQTVVTDNSAKTNTSDSATKAIEVNITPQLILPEDTVFSENNPMLINIALVSKNMSFEESVKPLNLAGRNYTRLTDQVLEENFIKLHLSKINEVIATMEAGGAKPDSLVPIGIVRTPEKIVSAHTQTTTVASSSPGGSN